MLNIVTAARALFGLSIGFHILMAIIGVGLPLFLLIFELQTSRTRDEMYKQTAMGAGVPVPSLLLLYRTLGTAETHSAEI